MKIAECMRTMQVLICSLPQLHAPDICFEGLPLCQVGIHSWPTLQEAVSSNKITQKALEGVDHCQDIG